MTGSGSLSNDDGDGDKNGKNVIGLISKTTLLIAGAACFIVHFFAVTARLQCGNA